MATNIQSTKLDFNNIKNRLKAYFKNKDEFNDYDFEGSGLSNILDVLAYNTHINGLVSNFATNESFLHTAQLRSSMIGHAENLGLDIRSKTAAQATVRLQVNAQEQVNRPASIVLPQYTVFTGSNSESTHSFLTMKKYTASDDGTGIYKFIDEDSNEDIIIHQGKIKTKTFYVGQVSESQVFIITDKTIDTSTAVVKVFPSPESTSFIEYTPLNKAIKVSSTSTYYTLREVPNGNYELNFGDGVTFGQTPPTGSRVEVDYLSTEASLGNGATSFTTSASFAMPGTKPLIVQARSAAVGGAEPDSIERIRQLAPQAFATQQRLVTTEDYKSMILSKFSTVSDVAVWGGEQNTPIEYGKVFISLLFNDGISQNSREAIKTQIRSNFTDQLSIMSITPVFVDPVELYLNLGIEFNYNPDLTGYTLNALESRLTTEVLRHFSEEIGSFGEVFRRSQLLSDVDAFDDSILSSKTTVEMELRLTPTLNTAQSYILYYPAAIQSAAGELVRLESFSSEDLLKQDIARIESSTFTHDGISGKCKIINRSRSNILEVINIDNNNKVEIDNIGSYNESAGTVSLNNFYPVNIISPVNYITFMAKPRDESIIRTLRNYVIRYNTNKSFISGSVDRETLRVSL